MDAQLLIEERLKNSVEAKSRFVQTAMADILRLAAMMRQVLEAGGTLYFFGNGGSAADAQHLAAEFVNRFCLNRRPLPALALSTDSSALTAIANDFSFEQIFSKQLEAFGKKEDLAVGISTSGRSPNVVKAIEVAKIIGMQTAALTGGIGQLETPLHKLCDVVLNVPSSVTAHIQEAHLFAEHILCELVERAMFPEAC